MSRVFGAILEFLTEDHGVFVVMTSNNAAQLPPELTRTGRLDSIWFFGFPDEEERKEIFKIHFNKIRSDIHQSLIDYAATKTSKFTGAEIKEAVKNTMRKAYTRYKKDNNFNILEEDIEKACLEIIPISKSSREKIMLLEEYAKNRARYSNKLIDSHKNNGAINHNDITNSLFSMSDIM